MRGGDKLKMKRWSVKESFISHFLCILFLIVSLPNYVDTNPIFFGPQQDKGKITGTITDEGNPIPSVTVTLTSDTGISQTTITSENGQFRFVHLPPGSYDVRVELPGFKTVRRSNINVSIGSSVSLTIDMTSDIDEIGGIRQPSIQPVRLPDTTTRQLFNLPHLDIPQVTLHDNIGLNPFNRIRVPMNTAECYYSGGRIYGINGVARIGRREERLKNITEFPYGDKRYTQKSLKVESGCVYAIRVREDSELKTLLIRVLEIFENRIRIEYWLQNGR